MNDVHPSGLTIVHGYLSTAKQAELIRSVDAQAWRQDLRRRVQHYGWRYDYKARRVSPSDCLGPLPAFLQEEAERLSAEGWFLQPPDQAIVNEYQPGQGIVPHVDCQPCFGDTVASLSLGSQCVMDLADLKTGTRVPVLLEQGSALILQGASRALWSHGIAARKSDVVEGRRLARTRRVSITFRSVLV